MITATVSFPNNETLSALFDTEQETFRHKRATYEVARDKNITITIHAQDATALKATVSSICRVLSVHEKASNG